MPLPMFIDLLQCFLSPLQSSADTGCQPCLLRNQQWSNTTSCTAGTLQNTAWSVQVVLANAHTPIIVLYKSLSHAGLTLECQHCYVVQMDLSSFVPQELSNVIWAYGTMQYQQNPEFLQRAAHEMLTRGISRFEPQAISNVCWAFAKHDLIYDEFLKVICQPTPAAICLAEGFAWF